MVPRPNTFEGGYMGQLLPGSWTLPMGHLLIYSLTFASCCSSHFFSVSRAIFSHPAATNAHLPRCSTPNCKGVA